jgi:hypothetical protein
MVSDSASVVSSVVWATAATEIGGIGDPIGVLVAVESVVLPEVGVHLSLYAARVHGTLSGIGCATGAPTAAGTRIAT